MDWYVPNDMAHIGALRRELQGLLARHSAPGSDVGGAMLVASELVTNALENSSGPVWVTLDWGRSDPVLTVHDLGAGFDLDEIEAPDPDAKRGRGLMIATHLVSQLSVTAKDAGGSTVRAELPVSRPVAVSIDPPRSRMPSLPHPDERQADGTYGREAFLRALVVQLAQSVEMTDGPAGAESIVAQVGADVGGRMEEAFRATNDIDGELQLDEIAELLVELKSAIGGDFYLVDADADRIVLGNRRCPFGEAVKQAPSLCRMTSSVFGGIASRNRGAAAVDLEQRIAVGDPQCKVTVWLRAPDEERRPYVHMYGSFPAAEAAPATP